MRGEMGMGSTTNKKNDERDCETRGYFMLFFWMMPFIALLYIEGGWDHK
jgi:hypothetical protein